MSLPPAIDNLIVELSRLPGIGRRGAERMAMNLVVSSSERLEALVGALRGVREQVGVCQVCGYFTQEGQCLVCGPNRDSATIMVMERQVDVVAMERAGGFKGLYHVLGGHLSPLKGITPAQLNLDALFVRLQDPAVNELVLATSPSVEGDTTALYITREAERPGLEITRLGRGMPMGGNLEHTDPGTLRLAFESRRGIHR